MKTEGRWRCSGGGEVFAQIKAQRGGFVPYSQRGSRALLASRE